ncbi:MAG: hypothetical protein JO307_26715 [Bryobacterales bacterium]|nr:hypothetical protein [Bryobacterales bacterium]MBV9399654.1 hypothetical protein [Bryobacterales bacterium]
MLSSLQPFYEWCGNTALGMWIRDTVWAFPLIETFHLLALAVLLGSVLIINLRILGCGARFASASQLAGDLEPWIRVSIVVGIFSGVLLFMSEPMKCYESYSFPVKMGLIVAGVVFHFTGERKWALGAQGFRSKLAAGVALVLWTGVGLAGKGIPYI